MTARVRNVRPAMYPNNRMDRPETQHRTETERAMVDTSVLMPPSQRRSHAAVTIRTWPNPLGSSLELAFEDEVVRDQCECARSADKAFGSSVAKALRGRLADIRAASSIADLIVGRPRPTGKDQLLIDLGASHQLRLCANHPKGAWGPDGQLDWTSVNRVRVLGIEARGD